MKKWMYSSHVSITFSICANVLIPFLIVCTALSAAPFDQGEAVEQGNNVIDNRSKNCLNSTEFCIPVSLSDLINLGIPKGIIIVSLTA